LQVHKYSTRVEFAHIVAIKLTVHAGPPAVTVMDAEGRILDICGDLCPHDQGMAQARRLVAAFLKRCPKATAKLVWL